jgi:glutaredoxin
MALLQFWRWLQRKRLRDLRHVQVVMYTRQGCHLCEDAWKLLREAQQRFGFTLDSSDVDSDAELASLHGDSVPVVTVNGKVRFKGRVSPVLLTRLLQGESTRANRVL